MAKRRIFISFDHDDTDKVNGFLGLRNIIDAFEFYNHKLDREVQSRDVEYVKRVISERYITPSSVCVVLIGNNTSRSGWVQWEIQECLKQKMGILGIKLKIHTGKSPLTYLKDTLVTGSLTSSRHGLNGRIKTKKGGANGGPDGHKGIAADKNLGPMGT